MLVVEYKPKPKIEISKNLKSKKYSIQFLPESMVPVSEHKTLTFNGKRIKVSYLIDIVHNLILKYYFKGDNQFNISSVILKEKYGHLYNYYVSYLIDSKILKLVRNHQKGKNARVYKIDEKVIHGKILRYKNSDSVLLKKYKIAVSAIEESNIESSKIDFDVKKKLVNDLFYVDVDFSKSIFYLDQTNQDTDIYNRNKYSVECISDRHIFYHFDSYGRMHTNFTILKSFIRKNCLMIDGEETVEIDIKNSQPLFLCKLIASEGPGIVDPQEFQLFKILTMNGNFYQYLIDNSEIKEKSEIKKMVYKVFFGKNFRSKADDIFKKVFPTIYNFIRTYKKEHGNYKVLAYDLQNLESNLIFNRIIRELMNIYPQIRIITVHDSLICQKKYRNIVEEIFHKNLKSEFSI